MNTIAPVTHSVNWNEPAPATTRSFEFVAAILEADVSPYMLGVLDAEKGEMACPEMYYINQGSMCEYCEGFEAVAGPTLTTRQFLGGNR